MGKYLNKKSNFTPVTSELDEETKAECIYLGLVSCETMAD